MTLCDFFLWYLRVIISGKHEVDGFVHLLSPQKNTFTRTRYCGGRHIDIKQFLNIFHLLGQKNMGTRSVFVAYTLQPDPPPWTLPEQGISRGWEPIHKGQALLG